MRVRLIVVCAILTLWAGVALGSEALPVDIHDYPWSAVGKLFNRAGTGCTAVLVSPTEAVTAAHCVYNPRNGGLVQPASLHLLLGYYQGEYSDDLRISKFVVGPNRASNPLGEPELSDWAVLTTEDPAPEGVRPLSPGFVPPLWGARS
jgi:protease YdgD